MKKAAILYERLDQGRVHCFLCAHHCHILPGKFGFCGVRQNIAGELFTFAYGKLVALNVDPIEKKPLYHFLPGTSSFSVATIGCNFHCGFCQNWVISQASFREDPFPEVKDIAPESVVEQAVKAGCASISYTYTEPTIFMEYALDTARLAREKGLRNVFVTNGYMTSEALAAVAPVLDAANVDLKFFTDDHYRKECSGTLQPVLDTIRGMHERGIWVEVTTLVIPGHNDSESELEGVARFLAGVSRDIPWHLSRFHPDYRYDRVESTPLSTLQRAQEIGRAAGLKYIYIGNVSARAVTRCPVCDALLVERSGFEVETQRIAGENCPECKAPVAGRWQTARTAC